MLVGPEALAQGTRGPSEDPVTRRGERQGWVGEREPAPLAREVPVIEEAGEDPRRARRRRPKHRAPVPECEVHDPVQHRDGKPPWCRSCGLDLNGNPQTARGRLTLVVRACDAALADPQIATGTAKLIEDIRAQATGDER